MASATTTSTPICFSTEAKAACRPSSSQCITLPTPPAAAAHLRAAKATAAYCRKIARNVTARATGTEVAPAEVAAAEPTEVPEIVKTIQQAWDKVEDKYAITSLGVASVVALCASSGVISAIDKLPLVPGVLELVGIGYTGWFAYSNLIFKPEREALIEKVKATYSEIIGSS